MVTNPSSPYPFETLVVAAATIGNHQREDRCFRLLIEGELDARIPLSSGAARQKAPSVDSPVTHLEDYAFQCKQTESERLPQIKPKVFLEHVRRALTTKESDRRQPMQAFYNLITNKSNQASHYTDCPPEPISMDALSAHYAAGRDRDWVEAGPEGENGMNDFAEIKSFTVKSFNMHSIRTFLCYSLSEYTFQNFLLSVPLMRIVFHNGKKSLSYVDVQTSQLCDIYV